MSVSFWPEGSFVVAQTEGGALNTFKEIVVQGDSLHVGDGVTVRRGTVTLTNSSRTIWLKLGANSRLRYLAHSGTKKGSALKLRDGHGVITVGESLSRLHFSSGTVELDRGKLRWTLSGDTPIVDPVKGTSLLVRTDGRNKTPLSKLRSEKFTTKELEPELAVDTQLTVRKYPSKSGSLIPGHEVLARILKMDDRTERPDSLKAIYGHWPRDRWGNVYFYRPGDTSTVIRSAGPDERMFTKDDRTWSERR